VFRALVLVDVCLPGNPSTIDHDQTSCHAGSPTLHATTLIHHMAWLGSSMFPFVTFQIISTLPLLRQFASVYIQSRPFEA